MTGQRFGDWIKQNRTLALLIGGLMVLLLIIWAIEAIFKARGPAPMRAQTTRFQVIGFYKNKTSHASFDAHYKKLTTVSPLWFSVSPSGALTDTGYDNSLVSAAHRHHIPVVPLFINDGGNNTVLLSSAARHRAAANILRVVQADHLDGVDIDFELLAPSSRHGLSAFTRDVARRLHPLHKLVEISVFPLTGISPAISDAYNYRALARSADYLVVMTYDHHYSGGTPGPVAPYGWVKSNVSAAIKAAPAKKIVLAIGMYGYDWVNNGAPGPAPTVPDVKAKAMAAHYGVPIHFIASTSQNMFTYRASDGTGHVVWFMGDRSAKARVQLARHEHLGGISLWELGQEDPAFWSRVP